MPHFHTVSVRRTRQSLEGSVAPLQRGERERMRACVRVRVKPRQHCICMYKTTADFCCCHSYKSFPCFSKPHLPAFSHTHARISIVVGTFVDSSISTSSISQSKLTPWTQPWTWTQFEPFSLKIVGCSVFVHYQRLKHELHLLLSFNFLLISSWCRC